MCVRRRDYFLYWTFVDYKQTKHDMFSHSKTKDTNMLLWTAFHKILKPGCKDLLSFYHKKWSWMTRFGSQSVFQFISEVLDRVKVVALCKVLPQQNWETIAFPKLFFQKVGTTLFSKISLYAVALWFSFIGTKGPCLNHKVQNQKYIKVCRNDEYKSTEREEIGKEMYTYRYAHAYCTYGF